MPQVPYNPVPEANPSTQATPTIHLNKKQAFGENVGEGLGRVADGMARMAQGADALARGQEKLAAGMGEEAAGVERLGKGVEKVATGQAAFGKALDHAGTEIFGRAIALQNLVNDADAREASTNYMVQVADLHANFNARQGKDAINALPQFKKDLVELRQSIRGTLSNPMAQKLYDSESQGTMSRTMFSGAAHAATSAKQFSITQLENELAFLKNAPYTNPNDPIEFAERRDKIIEATYRLGSHKAGISDPNDPMMKAGILIATSEQRANQIMAVARVEPNRAANMLTEFNGELTIGDSQKVENLVRAQSRAVGAANIAQQAWYSRTDPKTGVEKSFSQLQEEVRAAARKLDPNDPILESHALSQLGTMLTINKRAEREENLDNSQAIERAILGGATTVQQLRTDPKIAAAIDAMPEKYQNDLQGRIDRTVNSKNRRTEQETDLALHGLMNRDKEAFLDVDLTKKKLSIDKLKYYQDKQREIRDKPMDNPGVMNAAATIRANFRSELSERGILTYKKDENDDAYNAYIGTLAQAIELWQADNNGRRPSDNVIIKEIAPVVLKRRYEPRGPFGLFGSRKEEFFNQPASADKSAYEEFASTMRERVKAAGGTEPTDVDTKKAWTRMMLIKEFEQKKEKKPTP
jgi:hypothetical protein